MIIKGFTRPFYFLELAVTVQFKLAPLFKEIELMARLNIEQSFVEIPNQFHSRISKDFMLRHSASKISLEVLWHNFFDYINKI